MDIRHIRFCTNLDFNVSKFRVSPVIKHHHNKLVLPVVNIVIQLLSQPDRTSLPIDRKLVQIKRLVFDFAIQTGIRVGGSYVQHDGVDFCVLWEGNEVLTLREDRFVVVDILDCYVDGNDRGEGFRVDALVLCLDVDGVELFLLAIQNLSDQNTLLEIY